MISLCLAAAMSAAASIPIALPDGRFSLRWIHSIEKVEWQEDWRVSEKGLEVVEARIKGSGAGMEPADDAILKDGWYVWQPHTPSMAKVILGRSGVVADHRICVGGDCRAVSDYIGGTDAIVLEPCHAP
ncbi:DUF1850 domain-containing protein [Magnetospirillum sp. 64-120]|uniref:DUF1850 domain-containing protein n=1 Tax=Magnetospirillum sp. 64-120 TaxID=1895778 RepID=UPI000A9779ED|nr:DUF1850 domain-containing protein [Magnetospirillum sp. 64-120]